MSRVGEALSEIALKEIERGKSAVERLASDLNIALHSWAHWEALNGEFPASREALRDVLHTFGYDNRAFMRIFARDSALALMRMTDQRDDCLSLPAVARALRVPKVISMLLAKAKAWNADQYDPDASWARDNVMLCRDKIRNLLKHVPTRWDKNETKLRNIDLQKFREKARDIRDNALAHSLNKPVLQNFEIDEFRDGLRLITDLAAAAHLAFIGRPLPANRLPFHKNIASNFWHYAQIGFIQGSERARLINIT